MVAATGAISAPHTSAITQKLAGGLGSGLNKLAMGIFSLQDFAKVPSAFKLSYNRSAQKVAGINWTSGILETLKSLPKAAQYIIVPAAVTGFAAGFGPVAATIAALAGFGIPWGLGEIFEHLLPHEEEVIQKICQEKGIDITKPDGMPDINKPEGYLA